MGNASDGFAGTGFHVGGIVPDGFVASGFHAGHFSFDFPMGFVRKHLTAGSMLLYNIKGF